MKPVSMATMLLAGVAMAIAPTGFQETIYPGAGLTPATSMAFAPDGSGRLFITGKNGTVRIAQLRNGGLVTSGGNLVLTTFATETVYTNSEGGLLSVSFDPNFVANHYVYFFLSATGTRQQIVRYTDSNSVGVGRVVVVDNLPTAGQNHVGGATGFGPDGNLYWSIGDLGNGTGVNADLTSLACKVGRAFPDGQPVNDNPFNDGVGPNNEYIWARGFRNPFTLTFRPLDGALWSNTVGTGYEQVFVVNRADHAGYNAYENNQPTGFITPVVKYRTNGTDARNLTASGAVRDANAVVTFTTTGTHGFRRGEKITVAGVTDPSFNGVLYVTSTPTPTTWTANQAGPASNSGSGTATTQSLGGSITGGTFNDSTLFGATYRDDFFFGDYNSGQLTWVELEADGGVQTVDAWSTGYSSNVDLEFGPDGALYTLGVTSSNIKRITPLVLGAQLIVSRRNLRVVEGGLVAVSVSLAQAPAAAVTVSIAAPVGDGPVLTGASTLTFDATNWNQLQTVTFSAPDDANTVSETTVFTLAATGYPSEDVRVTSIDNNGVRLVLSAAQVSVDEGGMQSFTVALSKAPGSNVAVTAVRTSGAPEVTVSTGATLTFSTTNWNVPQQVTLSAAQDVNNVDEAAAITVAIAGGDGRTVNVQVLDDDPVAPLITSVAPLTAVVGAPYVYDVQASGRPAPTFMLISTGAGQTIDPVTGVVQWTPAMAGTSQLQVRASNGISPAADQTFTVTVTADQPPTIALTRPTDDERVSGTTGEFFGDCFDDVGCVRAEFFVDGVLISTDTNTGGHYHLLGEHARWDTTGLAPGSHQVRMTVFDTGGQSASLERQVCAGLGPCVPPVDAGTPDAGEADAGEVDAGEVDAGLVDAGQADAGEVDAGLADAGTVDGGEMESMSDAGVMPAPQPVGCGCQTGTEAPGLGLLLLALASWRRRRHSQR